MGWGNQSLFKMSRSHDQNAHYMVKALKKSSSLEPKKKNLLRNQKADDLESWYAALGN